MVGDQTRTVACLGRTGHGSVMMILTPNAASVVMAFAFYHDQSISSSEDYFECEGLIGAWCNSLQEAAALAGRQIC